MFESLIITLREGIEAALMVGIAVIYLRRSGRGGLVRYVYAALAAAVAGSIAGAVLLGRLNLNEEVTEGVMMIAAAVMVVTLVVWMQRHGKGLKKQIESRVEGLSASGDGGHLTAAWGVFLFTFLMVLREGIETVILLAAVDLTSEGVLSFLGGVLGIALAVAFGVAFVRGSIRIDLPRFFRVTAVVLYIFAAQLLIGGVHELAEAGLVPIGRTAMSIIGPIVKADALFIAAVLAIPLITLLIPGTFVSKPQTTADGPERRRSMAAARREAFWRMTAAVVGIIVVISVTGSYAFTRMPRGIDPPGMLALSGDEVHLPIDGLDDGRLHRFGVDLDGTVVRFLVMKGREGLLVTTLDACEVCGSAGYIQERDRLICLNCAADLPPETFGIGGGCNPIPLESRLEQGQLIIPLAGLRERAAMFGDTKTGGPASR